MSALTMHWRYLCAVLRHKRFVWREGRKLGLSLWRCFVHDWQKFLPIEWLPYANAFYGSGGGKTGKPQGDPDFDRAWLHHQHLGPHHWQYWLVIDCAKLDLSLWPEDFTPRICSCIYDLATGHDGGMMPRRTLIFVRDTDLLVEDSGTIHCLDCGKPVNREALFGMTMPDKYRREMLADWRGANRACPPADRLSRLLRAASAELARLFGPLLARLRRVLASAQRRRPPARPRRAPGAARAGGPARPHGGRAGPLSSSAGGGAATPPPAPLPRLLRAVIRAAAGLVTPAEADKQAAWDEARSWVDPRGHRLSARLWRNGLHLRARIDRQLAASVRAGHSPQEAFGRIAALLIGTPDAPGPGALRRLIVTEATRAYGRQVIVQAGRTGGLVRWVIFTAHALTDQCGRNARANPLGVGPGIYDGRERAEIPITHFAVAA
jgi:hypothetical protein